MAQHGLLDLLQIGGPDGALHPPPRPARLSLLSAIRVVHSNYYRSNRHGPSWQGMFKEILNFGRRAFAMWGSLGPFRYSLIDCNLLLARYVGFNVVVCFI